MPDKRVWVEQLGYCCAVELELNEDIFFFRALCTVTHGTTRINDDLTGYIIQVDNTVGNIGRKFHFRFVSRSVMPLGSAAATANEGGAAATGYKEMTCGYKSLQNSSR